MATREVVFMVKHRLGLFAIKSAKDWSFDDFLQHAKSNISSNSNLEFKYDIDGYIGCSLNSVNDWSSLMCLVQLLHLNIVNVTCYQLVPCDAPNVPHLFQSTESKHHCGVHIDRISNLPPAQNQTNLVNSTDLSRELKRHCGVGIDRISNLPPAQNQSNLLNSTDLGRESKRHCGVDIDRISNLPDPILCKILSLLPTKNAVATLVLSTKWKGVSPFMDEPITIDLDDSLLLNPAKSKSTKPSRSFTIFLDKLFNETLSGCSVDFMRLKCSKNYDGYKVSRWVDAAVRLKTRELVLNVHLSGSNSDLVSSLKGCGTLTRLELGKGFKVHVPEGFKLPNLKVLVLFKLEFSVTRYNRTKKDTFYSLIDGCPALEDLNLSNCRFPRFESVEIKSSVLKKLTIKDSLSCGSMCKLEIDVPSLEVLMYDDCFLKDYCLPIISEEDVWPTFKSLQCAHIDTGRDEPLDIEKGEDLYFNTDVCSVWVLVKACSNSTHLFLASQTISSLQRSDENLPSFENLTSLALGRVWGAKGWGLLAKLLINAPNLEKLTLEEGFGEHKGGYSSFVYRKPPLCLETRIKEVEFKVFGEEKDEVSLVEYFLNNGKAIQTLRLSCLPCKKASTLSRLRLLPQHSKIDFQPR